MDQSDLAAQMAALATELQDERDEQPTVEAIVAKAVEVVPDATSASLTIRVRRHRFVTLAATSDLAREADGLQYALDEGPCLEASESSDWLRSGDLGHEPRWPGWGPRVADLGVSSVLSVALYARSERIGALNMYAEEPGRFSDAYDIDLALLFAVHAAHALASARLVTGLEVAVSSRHDIGVAQGILMERYGLSLAQTFDLLRRISSTTNQKVADLARHIMDTGSVPTLEKD